MTFYYFRSEGISCDPFIAESANKDWCMAIRRDMLSHKFPDGICCSKSSFLHSGKIFCDHRRVYGDVLPFGATHNPCALIINYGYFCNFCEFFSANFFFDSWDFNIFVSSKKGMGPQKPNRSSQEVQKKTIFQHYFLLFQIF